MEMHGHGPSFYTKRAAASKVQPPTPIDSATLALKTAVTFYQPITELMFNHGRAKTIINRGWLGLGSRRGEGLMGGSEPRLIWHSALADVILGDFAGQTLTLPGALV